MRSHFVLLAIIAACGGPASNTPTATTATLAPPRPIAPLSTSVMLGARPTLRWQLAPGTDGAQVEICADRACTRSITTFTAHGASGTPGGTLPAGVAYWRLHARNGDQLGSTASPTWQFTIPRHPGKDGTSNLAAPDWNGDGYADVVESHMGAVEVFSGSAKGLGLGVTVAPGELRSLGLYVVDAGDSNGDGYDDLAAGIFGGSMYGYTGGAQAPRHPPGMVAEAAAEMSTIVAVSGRGDLDGDGYADLAVVSGTETTTPALRVYRGGPDGFRGPPAATIPLAGAALDSRTTLLLAGDLDGDGFGDLVLGLKSPPELVVYRGGPHGIGDAPDHIPLAGVTTTDTLEIGLAAAGDIDGDGHPDILVGPGSYSILGHGLEHVMVFAGGPGGLAHTPLSTFAPPGANEGEPPQIATGIGDLDGDGFGDVAIVDQLDGSSERVRIYRGGAHGLVPKPALELELGQGAAMSEVSLVSARDVNGDGFVDLVVASFGRTWVFDGTAAGPPRRPSRVINPVGDDDAIGAFAD